MHHRPSIVAIAAVLLACDDQLTKNTLEIKIGVLSSLHSLEKASVFSSKLLAFFFTLIAFGLI